MANKININEKLALFNDYFNPRIIAALNDSHVKLVKFKGEFIWHHHENVDELFIIIKGHMKIETKDGVIELDEGELVVIPKNVEHKPFAEEEVHIMLIEPIGTINTGNVQNNRTRSEIEFI